MKSPRSKATLKRVLMTPAEFDKALFNLIDEASTHHARGGTHWQMWSEVSVRLERTRSLVREAMTDAERRNDR